MATITKIERFADADEEPLDKPNFSEMNEVSSSLSLKEVAKTLKHLENDFNTMMKEAKKKTFDSQAGLSKEEATAIHLYTISDKKSDRTVAIHLNRALRSGSPEELKNWLWYLKLLISGLLKLPQIKSTVYRGARKNISDQYRDECVWRGFSSCTNIQHELTKFLNESSEYTLFQIECKTGIDHHKFSLNQEENEIILMPGTCFRVKGKSGPDNGMHLVHLVEVTGQNPPIFSLFGKSPSTVETFSISEASNSSTIQSTTPVLRQQLRSKMNIMTNCMFSGARSIEVIKNIFNVLNNLLNYIKQ